MEKGRIRGLPIVLAVYPSTYGFGYAVVEGTTFVLEASMWLTKYTRKHGNDKNAKCLSKISSLVKYYDPDVIVLEDYEGKGSRRYDRVRRLIDEVNEIAGEKNIRVHKYSRDEIRNCFEQYGAFSKYEIAKVIAARISDLRDRLPAQKRKVWLPEDYRMGIFDAMSLIFTFTWSEYGEGRKEKSELSE